MRLSKRPFANHVMGDLTDNTSVAQAMAWLKVIKDGVDKLGDSTIDCTNRKQDLIHIKYEGSFHFGNNTRHPWKYGIWVSTTSKPAGKIELLTIQTDGPLSYLISYQNTNGNLNNTCLDNRLRIWNTPPKRGGIRLAEINAEQNWDAMSQQITAISKTMFTKLNKPADIAKAYF